MVLFMALLRLPPKAKEPAIGIRKRIKQALIACFILINQLEVRVCHQHDCDNNDTSGVHKQ
jgi:hypothetical protein